MKFYITIEGLPKLKRAFLNLKLYSVVSVPEILSDLGYTYTTIDEYGAFIINQKITSLIDNYVKSKRIRGIIYSNPNLNRDIVENLFNELETCEKVSDLEEYYDMFREIIFFPSVKKIRLIECKPLQDKLNWKV